jgi:hypothetical protein
MIREHLPHPDLVAAAKSNITASVETSLDAANTSVCATIVAHALQRAVSTLMSTPLESMAWRELRKLSRIALANPSQVDNLPYRRTATAL